MKKLTLFVFYSFLSFQLFSQNFEKTYSFNPLPPKSSESANSAIELSNGNYLIAINDRILCVSQNGDSLYSKSYKTEGFSAISKLFRNNKGELLAAILPSYGRITFAIINETSLDTVKTFKVPNQNNRTDYNILGAEALPNGDIIVSYNESNTDGGIIRRFTPGSNKFIWSRDYASVNTTIRGIVIDDTTIVVTGYKAAANSQYELFVSKIGFSNIVLWSKQFDRGNNINRDNLIGITKNKDGNYLVATNMTWNDIMQPTVVVVGKNGDSLSASHLEFYNGKAINHGFLVSIVPYGNGFLACGKINQNRTAPDSSAKGVGFMAAFKVENDGSISGASLFNKNGIYEYATETYAGSEAWSNGGIATSDGYYLIYGKGPKLVDGGTGWVYDYRWRGYIVKSKNMLKTTAISKLEFRKAILFPNPSSDFLKINMLSYQPQLVTVTDINGRKVLQTMITSNEIDISGLRAGNYIITGVNWYAKFIKE